MRPFLRFFLMLSLLGAGTWTPLLAQNETVEFATYLGGTRSDQANTVATDPDGNLIVVGSTFSDDFPLLNPAQSQKGGFFDAFVTKLDPAGETLLWSTYLGGAGTDFAEEVRVDVDGTIFVIGTTRSDDFPLLNPFQATRGGEDDVFISVFDPDGTLLFSSYYGGSEDETGHDLALYDFDGDGDLDIYLTGTTVSPDLPLKDPTQDTFGGETDAFLVAYGRDFGPEPLFATYLGGSGIETGNAMALDDAGNVYVTGTTTSSGFATEGRADPIEKDVYLTQFNYDALAEAYQRLDTALPGLPAAGELDGDDEAWDIAFFDGRFYITGDTRSTAFPTTDDALQHTPYPNGNSDGFLMIVDPSALEAPVYSTVFGGGGNENAWSVDIDGGQVKVAGRTDSFTMLDGFPQEGSGQMYFLTLTLEGAFTSLQRYGTTPNLLVQSGSGNYVSGQSTFGQPIDDSIASVFRDEAGGGDAIVVCFAPVETGQTTLEVTKTADNSSPRIGEEVVYTITVTNTGAAATTDLKIIDTMSSLMFEYEGNDFIHTFSNNTHVLEINPTSVLEPGESRDFVVREIYPRFESHLADAVNTVEVTATNAQTVTTTATIFPTERDAMGYFFPLADSSGNVKDVWIGDARVVDDLAPGEASTFLPVSYARTEPVLEVVDGAAPDNTNPLASLVVDLMFSSIENGLTFSDTTVFVIAGLEEGNPRLIVRHDARTVARDPARVEFFLAHALPGAGTIDLQLLDDTEQHNLVAVLVDDLPEDTVSAYVALDPGTYNLALTSADSDTVLDVYRVDWRRAAGQAFMLVADTGPTLRAVGADGISTTLPVVTSAEAGGELPAATVLFENYPNPFHTSTAITYQLATSGTVHLAVFDVLGRLVRTLVAQDQNPGMYQVTWDGRNGAGVAAATGLYLYRLRAGGAEHTRSMLLVR